VNDLIDKGRACAQRVRDSKFPDYHAAKWLDRLADALETQSAENRDWKEHTEMLKAYNKRLAAENGRLDGALRGSMEELDYSEQYVDMFVGAVKSGSHGWDKVKPPVSTERADD